VQRKKEKAISEVMQDDFTKEELDAILGGSEGKISNFLCEYLAKDMFRDLR
jgi:hypothetical protein